MYKTIIYSVICATHLIFLTWEVLPFWWSGLIGVLIAVATLKFVTIDETWIAQIALLGVYAFAIPTLSYVFVVASIMILFWYSARNAKHQSKMQKMLMETEVKYE